MIGKKRWILMLLAAVVLLGTSCTNDALDDGSGPDVVLEIAAFTNPAVTTEFDDMTLVCTFTIEEWQVTLSNLPKNSLAGSSPFNDVTLSTVTINYTWAAPGLATPTTVVGLGGIAVPANGSATVNFLPIGFSNLGVAFAGETANLQLTFAARTIEGTPITLVASRELNIEECV